VRSKTLRSSPIIFVPRILPQRKRVRAAIYKSLQDLLLFPYVGRRQKAEHVRKLVTRRYPYLIYYTVNSDAEEIVILSVKHPARERTDEDA
jgi:toxin ParE1/3/4